MNVNVNVNATDGVPTEAPRTIASVTPLSAPSRDPQELLAFPLQRDGTRLAVAPSMPRSRVAPLHGSLLAAIFQIACSGPALSDGGVTSALQDPPIVDKMALIPIEYAALTAADAPTATPSPALARLEHRFYVQRTLVASHPAQAFTGLARSGPLRVVRFEITEDSLVARAVDPDSLERSGEIVARYRILSHFDTEQPLTESIRTTAATAVPAIRPWFQRRYIHVDFSRNQLEYVPTGFGADTLPSIPSTPQPVNVADTDPTLAAHFEADGSAFELGERDRLDVAAASVPAARGLPWNACELFDRTRLVPCGTVDVTMRVAFRRVEEQRDREVLATGQWRAERVPGVGSHNPRYPTITAGIRQNVAGGGPVTWSVSARHDLAERDHLVPFVPGATGAPCNRDRDCRSDALCSIAADPAPAATARGICARPALRHLRASSGAPGALPGADSTCARDEDCHGVSATARCDQTTNTCGDIFIRCAFDSDCGPSDPASHCDLAASLVRADGLGICTAPWRTRSVMPIAFHVTSRVPEELLPAIEHVLASWNDVFSSAITRARRRECQLAHGINVLWAPSDTEPVCNDPRQLGLDPALGGDARFVVIGCHSPVWGAADGPGQHAAVDVDAARARGWDLAACGPQGTVADGTSLRAHTIDVDDLDEHGESAWFGVAADPLDGHIVASHVTLSRRRIEALGHLAASSIRLAIGEIGVGDLGTPAGGAGIDAVEEPFQRTGLFERLARLRSLRELWPVSQSTLHAGALLGDGDGRADARFDALASTMLGQSSMGVELESLAPRSAVGDGPRSLVSPFGGEGAAIDRLRAEYELRRNEVECDLRYDAADVVLEPLAARLRAPVDCTLEPQWCIDGPPPLLAAGRVLDHAALERWARLHVAVAALSHEVGHALGAPHNLEGSTDALNYPDAYWSVRGRGHSGELAPRTEALASPTDGHYESAAERDAGNERVSASVMDLLDPYTAAQGPGRFDYAFVAAAYTDTAEAFRSVADRVRAEQYFVVTQGVGVGDSWDLSEWQSGRIRHLHYTQIPALFGRRTGGEPAVGSADRFTALLSETLTDAVQGWGTPAVSNVTQEDNLLVPYRAATESEFRATWAARAYDRGADAFESVHSHAEAWLGGYSVDATHVESTLAYLDNRRRRYVDPMRTTAQLSVLDDSFAAGLWSGFRSADTVAVGTLARATMALAAQTFVTELIIPALGMYVASTMADGSARYRSDVLSASGEFLGRPVATGYGPFWSTEPSFQYAGGWFDRLGAVEGLMESALTVRPADRVDIDLAVMFPDATLRLLGGLLADDMIDVGPVFTGTSHHLAYPDLVSLTLPEGPGPLERARRTGGAAGPVDPSLDGSLIALMTAHAVARLSVLGDRRFVRYGAVWTDDERAVPTEATVSFGDPNSGRTYRAYHIGAGAGEEGESVGASPLVHLETGTPASESGVAARLILHLRDLAVARARALAAGNAAAATSAEAAMRVSVERLEGLRDAWRTVGPR